MKRTNNGLPSFRPTEVCMTVAEITYDKMFGVHRFSKYERHFVALEVARPGRWNMLSYRINPSSGENEELIWISSIMIENIIDISDRRHGNPSWYIALMGKQEVKPGISLQLLEHVIAYAKSYHDQISVSIESMETIRQGILKANELKNK